VFRLIRPALLRVTVVRVYPTCKRIGSFVVRGRAGLNQLRFRGRVRGRALPDGAYRLVVRASGARRDAAAIPIVVARNPMSASRSRRLLRTSVCSEPVADLAPAVAPTEDPSAAGGVLGKIKEQIAKPVASAADAIAGAARGVSERLTEATNDPLDNPFLLTLVGVIALASAILGTIVLLRIRRLAGFRDWY
jgi:hypothetical protein